jgi:hypothetical protein
MCSYNDKVKEDEMSRTYSTNGEEKNAFRLLMGKPALKRFVRSQRRTWVENIKVNFGEIGCGGVDWLDLT